MPAPGPASPAAAGAPAAEAASPSLTAPCGRSGPGCKRQCGRRYLQGRPVGAHPQGLRDAGSGQQEGGQQHATGTRASPTTWAGMAERGQPVPVLHREGDREGGAFRPNWRCCRSSKGAMQPQAVSSASAAGAVAVHAVDRQAVFARTETCGRTSGWAWFESTRARARLPGKAVRAVSAAGSWRWPAYNYGEAGVGPGDRPTTATITGRLKLREACACRARTQVTTSPSCRRSKNNRVPIRSATEIDLPAIRDEPYFVTVSGSHDIDVAHRRAAAGRNAAGRLPGAQSRIQPAADRRRDGTPRSCCRADRGDAFSANLAAFQATGQPLASWSAYRLEIRRNAVCGGRAGRRHRGQACAPPTTCRRAGWRAPGRPS